MTPQTLPPPLSRLAWSNLAAQSAEQLSLAVAPLVAVLTLDATPAQIGLLAALQTLPFLLLALPLGLLADHLPRRSLMLCGEGLRLLALLLMLAAWLGSGLTIGLLALLGFLGAVGTVAFNVAAPGLVAAIVPRPSWPQANARMELARSAAFAAGPAVAGALVAWSGASPALTLACILSAAAMGLLASVATPPGRPRVESRNLGREIAEGALFAWRSTLLRPILCTGFLFNVSWFMLQVAYVPYALRTLGFGAATVGVTLGLYGLGMLVGALAAPSAMARLAFGRAIQIGPCAGLIAAGCLALTLLLPQAWLAGLCFFLLGAGPMVWTIATVTLRQNLTPDALLGRVSAVFLTVNAGARPLGAALGGWLGSSWGESASLIAALAGFAAQAMLILCSRVSALNKLPAPEHAA